MTQRIAVLIDGENISHRHFNKIGRGLQTLGELVVTRIYGDWSRQNMVGWKPVVSTYPINPVHQFQRRKNTIDFHLAMDAVDLLHRQPEIDCFCIVSSDSDFLALCLWLRDKGRTVIGCGEGKSSKEYMGCFNKFIVLDAQEVSTQQKPRLVAHNSQRDIIQPQMKQYSNKDNNLCGGER